MSKKTKELIDRLAQLTARLKEKQQEYIWLRDQIGRRLEKEGNFDGACLVNVRETRVRPHVRSSYSYVRITA